MKCAPIVLAFMIVGSALLSCTSVAGEPAYVPHEDPAAAESIMDPYSFLTQYADILALVSSKQYENASRLMEQLKFVSVPEDLRYIINRYNNLTQDLIGVLEDLEMTLDKASALLSQYRLEEASKVLDDAGILVAKAEILLGDLQEATATLSNRLGVFAAPAESKIREAYSKLQSILQRLTELVNQYHALLASIKKEASDIRTEELKPSELTLSLNATKSFVGGFVSASGVLTSNGQSLQNRTVELLMDGVRAATAVTASDGSYHTIVEIPYLYVHAMTANALYTPMGDDRGVYLASLSPSVSVDVLFYETKLDIAIPEQGYPGLPLMVSGNVTSQDGSPSSQRRIQILSDGDLLAETETGAGQFFEVKATVKSQTQLGLLDLAVIVEPKGVYAGTRQETTVNIVKISTKVDAHTPSFVLLPAGINVEGSVSSSVFGPLKGAKVTLDLATASSVVMTAEDGTFSAALNMPLSTVFAGFQDLEITVEPVEPWQNPAHIKVSVFLANPANMGLASAAFISVGAVLYLRFLKSKSKKGEKEAEVSTVTPLSEEAVAVVLPSKSEFKFEGDRGKIFKAYVKALRSVESATGCSSEPQMTLREFLHETEPKLGGAFGLFTDLTTLTERTLYSPHAPGAEDVGKAEDLAMRLGRGLGVGAA